MQPFLRDRSGFSRYGTMICLLVSRDVSWSTRPGASHAAIKPFNRACFEKEPLRGSADAASDRSFEYDHAIDDRQTESSDEFVSFERRWDGSLHARTVSGSFARALRGESPREVESIDDTPRKFGRELRREPSQYVSSGRGKDAARGEARRKARTASTVPANQA